MAWLIVLAALLCADVCVGGVMPHHVKKTPVLLDVETNETTSFEYTTEFFDKNDESEPLKCPRRFGMWPMLESCTQYMKCYENVSTVYTCPSGLHYNPASRECDYPQYTPCPYKCPSPDEEFPLIGDCDAYIECTSNSPVLRLCNAGFHWNKHTLHCEPEDIADCPFKCMAENGTFPYVDDCSSYIHCQYGEAQVKKCPPDLYFSMTSFTCVPKSLVECPLEFQCEGRSGQFPVLGDCHMYYECNENKDRNLNDITLTLRVCPSGLLYNFVKGQCDERSRAVCANQCPQPNGIFGIPHMCKYYMICTDGKADIHMCPDSLHFDPVLQVCDLPERSVCEVKCAEANTKMAVPQNCNEFVECSNYAPEFKFCPAHLHWNDLLKICDDPESAKCNFTCPEKYGFFPVIGICENYIACIQGVSYLKRCPKGLHYNRRTKVCDFPGHAKCTLTCPQADGSFPVDGDCSLYLHCSKSKGVVQQCAENLIFDRISGQCGKPANVVCKPECPIPNGRFTYLGSDGALFMECKNNIAVIRSCSNGLTFDPLSETCAQ